MAEFIDHLNQAKHNLSCAQKFLKDPSCRDWSITATFYSAVHFAEAGFTATPVLHTEQTNNSDMGAHAYRSNMVNKHFGKDCWKSYRKLVDASYNVRYLGLWKSKIGGALTYYSPEDVKNFIEKDLSLVRREIQSSVKLDLS